MSLWRPALGAGAVAFAAALAACTAVLVADLRSDVARVGDATAASVAAADASARPSALVTSLAGPGRAARVAGPDGRLVAQAGGARLRGDLGDAPWYTGVALAGAGGWTMLDGAVEASRALPGGRVLVERRALPAGTGAIGGGVALTALIGALLAGVAAGGAAALVRRRRRADLARLASAARVIAAGSGTIGELPGGDLAPVSAALTATRDRMAEAQAIADAQMDGVEATIAPLRLPVLARTPAGREVGNAALATLLDGLQIPDRDAVVAAMDELLAAAGRPASRRVDVAGGRVLDVEAWAIPGGRVAAVAERSEQERLRRLRRRLAGAAARHLRSPIADIQGTATELYTHVPAASAPAVQRVLAAADRMDRLVGAMLRSAPDAQARPPKLAAVGVSGLLWGLAQRWDRALRVQALRVELDIAPDVPAVQADAALVEEILTELIDNAAKFTPRGGTIRLVGRRGEEGVLLSVEDSGDGIDGGETALVTQPFFRGARSEVLPGAGLGLGVASALAERLGGRLTVQPGPGGRVTLELQAAPEPAAPAVSASAA